MKKPIPPSPAQLNVKQPDQAQKEAQQRQQAEHMAAIKGRGQPLGGAEEVKIPPLDADPMTDAKGRPMTMHQQAEALQDPLNPLSPYYDPQLAQMAHRQQLSPDADQMDPERLKAAREGRVIKHRPGQKTKGGGGPFGGIVPPNKTADPDFRPGIGSAYMANQPGLSGKSKPGAPALSEETVEGLEALHRFQEDAKTTHDKDVKKATDAAIEVDPSQKLAEELGLDNMEKMLEQFRSARSELDDPELREKVEARCEKLDVVDLIQEGEIHQDVPIVVGKFIPTYRTVSGEEDLEVKRLMYGMKGGEQWIMDFLALRQLACGLYAVNGHPLPSHLNDKGEFSADLFKNKLKLVLKYPMPMIASLSVNFTWFDQRTRRLFVDLGELKNG